MQVPVQKRSPKQTKTQKRDWHLRHFWSADQHFWSVERHFRSAEWHTFGPQLKDIGITLKHILFNFLVIRMRPSSYSDCVSYFFEPSSLYISILYLKILDTFLHSQISPLFDSPFWYFLSYVKEVLKALVSRISFL